MPHFRHPYAQQFGFALLQILFIALMFFVFSYMLLSLNQGKQRQLNSRNVGAHLSILINTLLTNTVSNNKCADGKSHPLTSCVTVSSNFAAMLTHEGLDPTTATVTVVDGTT